MTWSGFMLLWFLLALSCVLAGTVLTQRRASKRLVAQPLVRRPVHEDRGARLRKASCVRCTQPLEAGERFCGFCGWRRGDRL